jgi:hypothetical protein
VPEEARVVEADTPLLVSALRDPARRHEAAEALARLGTPEAAAALAPHAVAGGPLESVAVAGIGWHGGHVHADRLLAALRSADAATRAAASHAVGAAATADWARPLALALDDDRPQVKVAVLDAVGLARLRELAPEVGASPYLLEERTSDEDPVVASAAREALVPAPTEADRALAGPPCPSTPSDVVALRALLSDRAASVHERALAAVALARSPDPDAVSALAPVTDRWPRLVRAAALLARDRAGHVVRPDDVALERRAFDVARQAHPALVRALDACVEAALRAPVPPDGAHRTSAPAP